MKTKFLSIALLTGILFVSCKTETKKDDINSLSPERIQALTTQAYIFSYPLIMNYATMYKQAIDDASPSYVGGFDVFRHYGFYTSDNKDIVSPNNDTPYSWAWLDLRSEPWVLTMPAIDAERYYTAQIDDMWGFVLDSPGSVLDGQEGGTYLVASPEWNGTVPEGIRRVIRGESQFVGVLARTGANSPEDLPNVQKIQAGYKLMPLHEYLNQPAPEVAKKIDWIPFVNGDENTIAAFKYVNFALPFTLPDAQDKPALDSMAVLGITPGMPWDTTTFTNATKAAIRAGIADAEKQFASYRLHAKSGNLFNTRKAIKTDYMARTFGVLEGIFGNYASQATYISWHEDSDGNPINTANASYKVTFKKGETPPAKYFWSITMYNLPGRFLVANPIDRYSIGSRSKQLKTNPNGSIDIYISKTSPGKALESNWLPAPDGEPFIIMRVYGPGQSVLDGTYKLPPMVKMK
ncbi:MAG: DUF1254 domain-containing protein [Tannerella sp.]|jgi:hypothetical protein|nr:DUF1254 domain-containing protein [Tannerella sp.]